MTGACKRHWKYRKYMHNCRKPWKGAKHLERPRHRWEDNIKFNLIEWVLEVMEWMSCCGPVLMLLWALKWTFIFDLRWHVCELLGVCELLKACQLMCCRRYALEGFGNWNRPLFHKQCRSWCLYTQLNRGLQLRTTSKFQVPEGWPEVSSWWRPTNLGLYLRELSCPGYLVPGIFAPLIYTI